MIESSRLTAKDKGKGKEVVDDDDGFIYDPRNPAVPAFLIGCSSSGVAKPAEGFISAASKKGPSEFQRLHLLSFNMF